MTIKLKCRYASHIPFKKIGECSNEIRQNLIPIKYRNVPDGPEQDLWNFFHNSSKSDSPFELLNSRLATVGLVLIYHADAKAYSFCWRTSAAETWQESTRHPVSAKDIHLKVKQPREFTLIS
jgi:hypothetical protein